MQLDTDQDVRPDTRTVRVDRAAVVPRQAEPTAQVRRRDLLVAGETERDLQASRVGVGALEDAELDGRTQAQARVEEIAGVERGPEHELAAAEVEPAAHAEAEQAEPRSTVVAAPHGRRMELLSREGGRERERRQRRPRRTNHTGPPSPSLPPSPLLPGVARLPRVAARP